MEYIESDLVRIAKRENNTKRNYLVVNPLQGKHIPVKPSEALSLFVCLANKISTKYNHDRLLLVGFAETATAIGAQVALTIGTKYIQTTREPIQNVEYLFFSEEHSHATEQKLIKNDIDLVIDQIERIIFIEDEVTTGKTILNIIKLLDKEYSHKLKYSVASLLNGMNAEHMDIFEQKGIDLFYLVKTNHSTYGARADNYFGNGNYYDFTDKADSEYASIYISGKADARRLVSSGHYMEACEKLWIDIKKEIGIITGKKFLIIGTEEFMYPPLFIGKKIEEMGNEVMCHSTTRSPISVSLENEYPLHNRYEIKSLYDSERKTYLYDIGEYDKVFVITDAPEKQEGIKTLVSALKTYNENITVIRWC